MMRLPRRMERAAAAAARSDEVGFGGEEEDGDEGDPHEGPDGVHAIAGEEQCGGGEDGEGCGEDGALLNEGH